MRNSKAGWIAAALLGLAFVPLPVAAQARGTVAGTVIDQATNAPLSGVQISIAGTQLGTITTNEGRFVIVNVPAGTREVRATMIGYSAGVETVQVSAGETTTVNFSLATSAVALEEIVVTGTVGAVQRREQPAVVATINAAQQTERGTSTSVTDLLTARVPGVQVTASSGTTGTAQQIRIRGASSITLSNEPLVFIDGIKASNRTMADINIGGQAVSQLFDLNPEDIESIEVVKGPAAATLYGADASAGVIQIITKQGRPGANRYSQTISLEYNQLDQNWTPPMNWGRCTASDVAPGSPVYLCQGLTVGTPISDQPLIRNNTFRDGHLRSLGYSGRGGGENYGYYVSLGWDDEEATLPNNTMDRRSGRVNFTFVPRSDLRFEAGLAIGNTESTFPINDNNIYGFLGGGLLGGPRGVRQTADSLWGGWYIGTRNQVAITNIESAIETLRYTPSITTHYTPTSWFTNRFTLGADVSRTQGTQFFPRNTDQWYGGDLNLGSLEEERINFDVYTVDYLGTFSTLFGSSDEFKADFSVGFQAIAEVLDNVVGFGTDFVTNANRVIGDAVQISADQDWQKTTSVGYLGQANLGFWDRLYVQLGARIDQFSSFGEEADPFFLPQAGVSYVISDEDFWDPIASIIPSLRLRVAYGTTGRAPSAGASLETYSASPYSIIPGESGSGVTPDRPGNFELKPEKGTEYEAGFEMGFLDQRLGLDVTYFHKTTTDLILTVPVPPSSGFSSNPFRNIGEVLNKGWEIALRGTPVNIDRFRWDFNATASTLHNELIDLGGVEPFGTQNRFDEGLPLGVFHGYKVLRIENDTAIVTNDRVELGNLLPDFEGAFATTLTLFDHFALSGQLDWKQNFKIYNNTAQFRDRSFGNSELGVKRYDTPGVTRDEVTARFGPFFTEDGAEIPFTQVQDAYIQDGDFVRLREVALTVTLPQNMASAMRAANASLTLGVRNLKLWTDYDGHDPEVLAQATRNTGVGTFQREDFLTVPSPRRWVAKLNLTF